MLAAQAGLMPSPGQRRRPASADLREGQGGDARVVRGKRVGGHRGKNIAGPVECFTSAGIERGQTAAGKKVVNLGAQGFDSRGGCRVLLARGRALRVPASERLFQRLGLGR
jgi:hypothetical protein